MKNRIVKALAERVGQDRAEKFWALFVAALCGGIEPQEGDTFTREDIAEAFASNIPARNALVAVLCGDAPAAPKGRKFKADKACSYSAGDLVSFIVADPKQDGLRAEYMRRTGGAAALFYVDGKIAEAESADRIQRLFDRDPVAPFVVIDGAEVTPVGYPEPDAKQDAEDPYQRGVALGQPGDISARLGVSLAAIPHDTMQAIACAVENDLADASKRDLQRDAEAAKGKSPAEYLADKPLARRAWPTWKKPTLMLARTPRNPPAAAEVPGTLRGNIDSPTTADVCAAVISAGLSRVALMAGIERRYVATLPTLPDMTSQTHSDVHEMVRTGQLPDGSNPWRQYLTTADHLAYPRREAAVFRAALAATPPPKASAPLLFVLTCGETKWKDMRLQFVPAARAGKIEVVADVDCPPGSDTRRWFAEQVDRAAALLVLANTTTMSSDAVASAVATVRAAGKRAFPVMVRPCLTQYGPFAGKVFLLDGALYSDDNGPGIVSGVMGALGV